MSDKNTVPRQTNISGRSRLPEYKAWCQMRSRCGNPKLPNYKYYGARGITVCESWAHSFDAFFADVGPRPSALHSIERKDNNKGYSPDNCRWATQAEQQRNRRNNRRITWNGRTQVITDWAIELGTTSRTINSRLKRGWSVERTMTTPLNKGSSWRRGLRGGWARQVQAPKPCVTCGRPAKPLRKG